MITSLEVYSDSFFESKRDGTYERQAIDNSSRKKLENVMVSVVRFSTWIRFLDKQIGMSTPDKIGNFVKGISFILEKWQQHGLLDKKTVEIITVVRDYRPMALPLSLMNLKDNFLKPLKTAFPSLHFRIIVKRDSENIFHARHLLTQNATVSVERGFDFFNKKDGLKKNYIQIIARDEDMVKFMQLPEVEYGSHNLGL
jgi:hypothetical protein